MAPQLSATVAAECVELRSDALRALIHPRGAELRAMTTVRGHDLIWPGAAPWWERSAPILFPVIGRLREGCYLHAGQRYEMPPHGFAMDAQFERIDARRDACSWRLAASPRTRAVYPFEFELWVRYTLEDRTLRLEASVLNTGSEPLPLSLGFHPALHWPIRAAHRAGHWIDFAAEEPAGTRRRLQTGLFSGPLVPLPLTGRRLLLDDDLFVEGAHVLAMAQSRQATFGDAEGPLIRLQWRNLTQLALWSQVGAPFVCIEPWAGLPDSESGDDTCLAKREGTVIVTSKASFEAALTLHAEESLLP